MGANMFVRRTVFDQIGGFDEDLGPGGTLLTGEECELTYRALQHSVEVVREPGLTVTHWGARPVSGDVAKELVNSGFFAVGAGYGKHIRSGDGKALTIMMHETVVGHVSHREGDRHRLPSVSRPPTRLSVERRRGRLSLRHFSSLTLDDEFTPGSTLAPKVTVLVCTRNRRDNVLPTVRSIQACGFSNFEVLILDQSDDSGTADALASVCSEDPRVQRLKLERPGKPMALNEGLSKARGAYVLLTDDDCEVRPGWIETMVAELVRDPLVGLVYGTVEAGPHDPSQGYIPAREITRAHFISSLSEFLTMPGWENYGMGANMAFRKEALVKVGGWDDCIGPGAKFGSGDDNDVAVARLDRRISGQLFTGCARRPFWAAVLEEHAERFWRGVDLGWGLWLRSILRCGVVFTGGLRAVSYEARQCLERMARLERPRGVTFLSGWARGFLAGMRQPGGSADAVFLCRMKGCGGITATMWRRWCCGGISRRKPVSRTTAATP